MSFPITIDGVGYDEVADLIREITRRAENFVLPGRASAHPGAYFDRFRADPGAAAALDEACEAIVRSHDNGDAVALAVAITPSGASRPWVEAVLALSRIDVPDSRHYGTGPEIRRRALANLEHGIGQLAPELFPKYVFLGMVGVFSLFFQDVFAAGFIDMRSYFKWGMVK